MSKNKPLVIVVGETASGKSALAIRLARTFQGEIVCADSRTVYRGLDIGTAKPSKQQDGIVHHLIDIADPDKPITVAQFKEQAALVIEHIHSKNKLPILVGGTGLYIDAILFDYSFGTNINKRQRPSLQKLSVSELRAIHVKEHIALPSNETNPRHLIRSIEVGGDKGTKHPMRDQTIVLQPFLDREQLDAQVRIRLKRMISLGLEEEALQLLHKYGEKSIIGSTIGYQEFIPYFRGLKTINEVHENIIKSTLQYAKRQRTWFRRNKDIQRVSNEIEAVELVTTFLNNSTIGRG